VIDQEPVTVLLLETVTNWFGLHGILLILKSVCRSIYYTLLFEYVVDPTILDTTAQVRRFYRLLHETSNVAVVDEPVPRDLVTKYVQLGLPEKADAVVGAFVEWVGAGYLISDNRHFLQGLDPVAFQVLSPAEFLARLGSI
jgi:hypothetical protein